MTTTTATRRPLGAQAVPPRPTHPEVPAGEPLIGVLGGFAARTRRGSQLALRCRRCPLLVEGDQLQVHAELRQHHRDVHGLVPTAPAPAAEPAAPAPDRAVCARPGCSTPTPTHRHRYCTPEHRPAPAVEHTGRGSRGGPAKSLLTPCEVILTGGRAGARRGQPCRKPSADGTCWGHATGYARNRPKVAARRAAARAAQVTR